MGSDAGQLADNIGEEQTETELGIFKHGVHNQAAIDELYQYL